MKILIVFTSLNKRHKEYAETIRESLNAEFASVDMASGRPLHEIFYEIRDTAADLVITFDLAGFEFFEAAELI